MRMLKSNVVCCLRGICSCVGCCCVVSLIICVSFVSVYTHCAPLLFYPRFTGLSVSPRPHIQRYSMVQSLPLFCQGVSNTFAVIYEAEGTSMHVWNKRKVAILKSVSALLYVLFLQLIDRQHEKCELPRNVAILCRIWSSHGGSCESCHLVRYSAGYSVYQSTFRRNISLPPFRVEKSARQETWVMRGGEITWRNGKKHCGYRYSRFSYLG
jgi:hypothetical protein